jgi:hypothetical protein
LQRRRCCSSTWHRRSFLVIYLVTKNVPLSVVLGMALGVAQIGWQFVFK